VAPGDRVSVFDRDFLAGEAATWRALDVRLHDPRAVFVFVALRPVIGAAFMFYCRDVIRQRRQLTKSVCEGPDVIDKTIRVLGG
jgi:hypothetical protein